jgi:uncharacterized membrane protein YfcA
MACGGVGAALLLVTPPGLFARVVPFLLLIAALGLLAQPRVSAWQDARRRRHGGWVLCGGVVATSLYNGYFGAGAGVMTLALVLLAAERDLARANAVKNMLVGASSIVAAAIFVGLGHVDWRAAWPLALGLLAGSTIGPSIARKIPGNVLRVLVALSGIGLAAWFWASSA